MIKAVPQSATSGDFKLMSRGRQLGSLFLAPWRESGVLRIGEERYEICKMRPVSLRFRITKNGEEIGWATQESYLGYYFQVDIDGGVSYRVKSEEARRLAVAWDPWGGGEIVAQDNLGQVRIRLPEEVPLEDQALLFGVAQILWGRGQFILVGIPVLLFLLWTGLETARALIGGG